ncbi:MAG: fibronectin type III domain-containing protein [bacterium]
MAEVNLMGRQLLVVLLLSFACSCGASGTLPGSPEQAVPMPGEGHELLPAGQLPPFPDGFVEREFPATTSDFLNTQTGRQAIAHADPGIVFDGEAMEMVGDSGAPLLYGMWRWGQFSNFYPIKALLDFEIAEGSEFYVLRANYVTGRWNVVGPLGPDFGNDGRLNYPETGYISPEGYCYVAVLVAPDTDMTVHSVTVLSNDDLTPPVIPQNLVADEITPGAVALNWDDVTGDTSLDGYNVYSGPAAGFQAGDEGVVRYNDSVVEDSEFVVSGLVPGTTYHFAVSAIDIVDNESPYSESLEVQTLADAVPDSPTGLTADYVGSTTAEFSWTAPADEDLAGYNIYIGFTDGFELADGIVQQDGLYLWEAGTRDDLQPLTQYWARVTAVDIYNQESPPSGSIGFTTVANAEPQVDWLNTPGFVQKSVETIFDPRLTQDPDNDLSQLEFVWDFDDDDVPDFTSTGPELVYWTWDELGDYPVSLTVSDPFNTVELVRTITVNRHFKRYNFGYGEGYYATVQQAATDPESGSAAVLVTDELVESQIKYFNGSGWSTIEAVPEGVRSIAVSSEGVSALSVVTDATGFDWTVHRYNGGWQVDHSGRVSSSPNAPAVYFAQLAASSGGRHSVAFVWAPIIEGDPTITLRLQAIHEKADGSLSQAELYNGSRSGDSYACSAIARDGNATFILDNVSNSPDLDMWRIDDTGSSLIPALQPVSGLIVDMQMTCKPGVADQVHWVARNAAGRFHYGDNYGAPNGAGQYHDAGAGEYEMSGSAPLADNEGMFYWTKLGSDGVESIGGYSSTTDTEHGFGAGRGYASSGCGAWHAGPSGSGILLAVNERRDGEVFTRLLNEDQNLETTTMYEPSGDASVFSKSAPIVFPDNTIYNLHQMRYPSILVGSILPTDGSKHIFFHGNDTYVVPNDACHTMNFDEFMVVTRIGEDQLLVNRMMRWQSTGEESLHVTDASLPEICFSPGSGAVMLVYTSADGLDLMSRTWALGSWGSAMQIASSATPIRRLKLAPRYDGEYGLCWANEGNQLMFQETQGGVWDGGTEIHSGPLNLVTSHVGIDYNPDNRAAVVAQRDGAGIWVGLIPDGGSVSWEEADPLTGEVCFSLGVAHGSSPDPVILYQKDVGSLLNSKLYINERINGNWVALGAAPNVDIIGIPLGFARDSLGNVIVSGMDASDPFRALCIIYYD